MRLLKRVQDRRKQAGYQAWATKHSVAMPVPGRPGVLAVKDESAPTATNDQAMTADFVITSVSPDRHGDIVQPEGCRETLQSYLEYPVVLLNHAHHLPPIGTAARPDGSVALTIEATRILSTAHFSNSTEDSRQTYALIKEGIFRGASIGFRPRRARRLSDPYADEDCGGDEIDFESNRWALEFLKWELLEWSVVGIPANPDALVIQSANEILSKGVLDSRPLSHRLKNILQPLAQPRRLWETHMTKAIASAPVTPSTKTLAALLKELEETPAGEGEQTAKAVQALLVPKADYADADSAAAKAEEHGLDSSDVEELTVEDTDYWAFIQFEPDLCDAESVEHEMLDGGLIAVLCSKGEDTEEDGKASRVAGKTGHEESDGDETVGGKHVKPKGKSACAAGVCECKKPKAKDVYGDDEKGEGEKAKTDDKPILPGVALAKALAQVLTSLMPMQENSNVRKACVKTIKIWKGVCTSEYPEETFGWPEDDEDKDADTDEDEQDDETDEDDTQTEDEDDEGDKSKSLLFWRKMSKKRQSICRDVCDWLGEHANEENLTRTQRAACKQHYGALKAMLAEVEEAPEEDENIDEKAIAELVAKALIPFAESQMRVKETLAQLTGVRVR
jgi:phage head maturation protease